jgi:glucose/arabinose dehydrogenase
VTASGARTSAHLSVSLVVAGLAAALLAACSDDDGRGSTTTREPGSTATSAGDTGATDGGADLDAVELAVEEVAVASSPTALTFRRGAPSLFVAERVGRVRQITIAADGAARLEPQPVLDISDRVITGGEQGLLGLAFSPDGDRLYVSYNDRRTRDSVIDEYALASSEPVAIDEGSRREIIRVDQPRFGNHKGGDIHFGPDGYLYWGLGDGGSQGDPDDNGQDTRALLAKVLRIDPAGGGAGRAYGIPDDNPFADGEGGAPEVFLYGVRNPWRFSFDARTGDLWIADVGGSQVEEVDLLAAADGGGNGANLGWSQVEGTRPLKGDNPRGALLPLYEYDHSGGACAVTGGYVYRGDRIAGLDGVYLMTDYCAADLRGLAVSGGRVVAEREWDLGLGRPVAFGEGPDRELYVLDLDGPIFRLTPG